MIIKFNKNNSHAVDRFADTDEMFVEFKSICQIDNLIRDLEELKAKEIIRKHQEVMNKRQLKLNFQD